MIPLGTGNSTCFPVTVSSELCKKRRINQDFPTMRDSICHKKRKPGLSMERYILALQLLPPSSLEQKEALLCKAQILVSLGQGRFSIVHSWATPAGTCSPHQSPLVSLLGSSLVVLPHPANSKQQARLLHDDCQNLVRARTSIVIFLKQHLATAWTCSYRDKECEPCDVGLSPTQGNLEVPSSKKPTKSPLTNVIDSLPNFQILREINNIIHMGSTYSVKHDRNAKNPPLFHQSFR